MKKTFKIIVFTALSIALIVCAAVFFTQTSSAMDGTLYVKGIEVTGANADILGNGVFSFDGDRTLTISGDYSYLSYSNYLIDTTIPDFVINVETNSTLTAENYGINAGTGRLTVTGKGKLTIKDAVVGINCGSIVFDHASVEISAYMPVVGSSSFAADSSYVTLHATESDTGGYKTVITGFSGGFNLTKCSVTSPEAYRYNESSGKLYTASGSALTDLAITPLRYGLRVAGVLVTSRNAADVLGDGAFYFDGNKTLNICKDCTYTANGHALIDAEISGLTVKTFGDRTLNCGSCGIYNDGKDVTITGDSLTINAINYGIYAFGVTVDHTTLNISTELEPIRNDGVNAALVFDSSNVTLHGSSNCSVIPDFRRGFMCVDCGVVTPSSAVYNTATGVLLDGDGQPVNDLVVKITEYGLRVVGVEVNAINRTDILGDGVFSFDGCDTLTINGNCNATISGSNEYVITSHIPSIVLNVESDSVLTSNRSGVYVYGSKTMTVTGQGKLTINAQNSGIRSHSVHFDRAEVEIKANKPLHGTTNVSSCTVSADSSSVTLTATGSDPAITLYNGGLTLQDCSVTTPVSYTSDSYHTASQIVIEPDAYNLTIAGVPVTTRNYNDVLGNGVFSFDKDKTLTIADNYTYTGDAYLINATIDGFVVKVTSTVEIRCTRGTFLRNGPVPVGEYVPVGAPGNPVTLTGSGSLKVIAEDYGVYACGVTIDRLPVNITALTPIKNYKDTASGRPDTTVFSINAAPVTLYATSGAAVSGFGGGFDLTDCAVFTPAAYSFDADGVLLKGNGNPATDVMINSIPYDLTVAGVAVTSFNYKDILGDGVFSFDGDKTLTVNGTCSYYGGYLIDSSIAGFTVKTVADSSLSCDYGINVGSKVLTLSGVGQLVIGANNCAVCASGVIFDHTDAALVAATPISSTVTEFELSANASSVMLYSTRGSLISGRFSALRLTDCGVSAPYPCYFDPRPGKLVDETGSEITSLILVPNLPSDIPEVIHYDLTVAGVEVTSLNMDDILGDGGTFSFDGYSVLDVNKDFDYDGTDYLIHARLFHFYIRVRDDVTIVCAGAFLKNDTLPTGLYVPIGAAGNPVTVLGRGSLKVFAESFGIYAHGLSFDHTNVEITAAVPVINQHGTLAYGETDSATLGVYSSNVVLHATGRAAVEGYYRFDINNSYISSPASCRFDETAATFLDENDEAVKELAFAVTKYDLTIAGIDADYQNYRDVLGNGVFSFDGEHTLTVNGDCQYDGTGYVISADIPGLIINVTGNSSLTNSRGGGISNGSNDLTITGNGTLILNVSGVGVLAENLAIARTTLAVTARTPLSAAVGENQTLTIGASNVTLNASGAAAVSGFTSITLSACGVLIPEPCYYFADDSIGQCSLLDEYELPVKDLRISKSLSPNLVPVVEYDLIVAGECVTTFNRHDIGSAGVFSFDGDHTLTINGDFTYDVDEWLIDAAIPLTVRVIGDSTIDCYAGFIRVDGYALTVTGLGKLKVTAGTYGLLACGVTLDHADVQIASRYPVCDIDTNAAFTVISSNVSLTATQTDGAVVDFGSFVVKGCTVNKPKPYAFEGGVLKDSAGNEAKEVTIKYTYVYFDVDGSGSVDISDVTALLDYLAATDEYVWVYDLDNDKLVTISDVTALLDYLSNPVVSYTQGLNYQRINDENGVSYKVMGFSYYTTSDVVIPATYYGIPVTAIGNASFMNCSATSGTPITSIVIPNTVTEIGERAFRFCDALTTVTLPASLQTVGANAFDGCSALTTVYYHGSAAKWATVTVGSGNAKLTGATILFS